MSKLPTTNRIWVCTSCSHSWLGPNSTCTRCGAFGKSDSGEFTKKIVDDSDLKKAL